MRSSESLVRRGALGEIRHYRSCRLQARGTRGLGWRQIRKLAGTGELGDMLSHRIDFAHLLVGPMARLVANARAYSPLRDGAPNDTDDWVAILAEFRNGASGVLESSKLASSRNESWRSLCNSGGERQQGQRGLFPRASGTNCRWVGRGGPGWRSCPCRGSSRTLARFTARPRGG